MERAAPQALSAAVDAEVSATFVYNYVIPALFPSLMLFSKKKDINKKRKRMLVLSANIELLWHLDFH